MKTIIEQARESISKYCYEECKSYCCRKGYLVITPKQAKLITENNIDKYIQEGRIKKLENKKYSLKLEPRCPRLIEFKCTIHKEKGRPKVCKEFPIFVKDKKIILSQRCPAIKEEKIYPYIAKLIKKGYKLEKGNPYIEYEEAINHN